MVGSAAPSDLDFGLTDRVAVVTGAGSRAAGIGNGRAAAVLLAQAGCKVVLVDKTLDHVADTKDIIDELPGRACMVLEADVSDVDDCERVVAAVIRAWGGLDVLVNNVGISGPVGGVDTVDLDRWDLCLRVNLNSVFYMSRFAVPQMRARGMGSIVNVSSVAGLTGGSPLTAYSTAKGAVVSLTRTLAAQLGSDGIRVNAVAPGFVHTPIVYASGMSDSDREMRRLSAPLQTEGSGWDVGHAILFLASNHSRWITGVTVPVDAGLTSTGIKRTRAFSEDEQ